MICIALGLGVLGFVAARKARRCGGGYGFGGGWHQHRHHGWHGHHGGGMWGHRRAALHMALAHIDATPAQERAIVAEMTKLHDRLHGARASLKESRSDLASAIRGPSLDDAALGGVLGRVDGATGEARTAFLDALRNIHALLDNKQREMLADLLERGGGWSRRGGGGPYRV